MMSKYKIRPYREGFKVWELRNIGGWVWDDVKTVFKTREEAEEYIRRRKEGETDEGIS